MNELTYQSHAVLPARRTCRVDCMRIPLGTAVVVASGRSVTSAAHSRTLSCTSARLSQPNAPPDARNPQRLTDTRAAMSSYAQFNPARLRSYVLRLPLATRLLLTAIVGLWIATIPLPWLREFSQLEPAKMDLTQSMLPLFLRPGYVVEVPQIHTSCVRGGLEQELDPAHPVNT
jgi:hypothetical protein